MSKLCYLPLFLVLYMGVSHGQNMDTLLLDGVEINDTKLELFSIGGKVEKVPLHLIEPLEYSNVSELLMKYSGVSIRSYGPGGLSTAAVRGAGSSHTPVFWEGINLQSSTNGTVDLTLIPMSFVDQAAVQYGGGSSLFGSGSLGGAIHLSTRQKAKPLGFSGKVIQQFGSFESAYTGVNLRMTQKKLTTVVRGFVNRTENNFSYFNRFSGHEDKQKNASVHQQGILAEAYYKITKQDDLTFKYWLQDNLVHISAPASAGNPSQATQADLFHRAVVDWKHQKNGHMLKAKTALLAHELVYDDKIFESSSSKMLSWVTQLETNFQLFQNIRIDAGFANNYDYAAVDGYAGVDPVRNRTALYLASRMLLADRLEVNVNMREAYTGDDFSPLLPTVGFNYAFNKDFALKARLARSYRIPTFNDLYWKAGGSEGNPDLKPEVGWSSELGVQLKKEEEALKLKTGLTAFSNYISQWIQWVPMSASGWTPINVQEIWARGFEFTARSAVDLSDNFQLQAWGNYSYTRSTKVEIDEKGNAEELNKQVIYTPVHQGKAAVDIAYKKLNLCYSQIFVGPQFITGDNSRSLSPYTTTDISLLYQMKLYDRHRFKLYGQVRNIFDKNYEIRNARPMPGRNFNFSIRYLFD